MKLRESGMPEEAHWETLFDVPLILDQLGIDARLKSAVELGCGYGTFTIPVARRIAGTLTTFDIDEAMIERTRQRAAAAGVGNILYVMRDVFADGFGVKSASQDACLLFNILHAERPAVLLREAWRVLRPGGRLGIIHWNYDPTTPRGPSMSIRPRPEECRTWAEAVGFRLLVPGIVSLPPYHYGMALEHP